MNNNSRAPQGQGQRNGVNNGQNAQGMNQMGNNAQQGNSTQMQIMQMQQMMMNKSNNDGSGDSGGANSRSDNKGTTAPGQQLHVQQEQQLVPQYHHQHQQHQQPSNNPIQQQQQQQQQYQENNDHHMDDVQYIPTNPQQKQLSGQKRIKYTPEHLIPPPPLTPSELALPLIDNMYPLPDILPDRPPTSGGGGVVRGISQTSIASFDPSDLDDLLLQ